MLNHSTGSRLTCAVLLCSAAALFAGCQAVGTTGLSVWAAGSWQQVLPHSAAQAEEPLIFSQRANLISLWAARNETISFQLVLTASQSPVDDVSIRIGQLVSKSDEQVSKIGADDIRLYKVRYMRVENLSAGVRRLTWPAPAVGREKPAVSV